MSTWFSSFSLPNPFQSDSDDGDGDGDSEHRDNNNSKKPLTGRHSPTPHSSNSIPSPTSGVRQDLSALSQSFSQHLRGVAVFLAPPPGSPSSPQPPPTDNSYLAEEETSSSPHASNEAISGIKKDLVEIGGSFKALWSSSSTGISKFASNLLQFEDDDGAIHDDREDGDDQGEESQEDIPGINEEVVDFVRKVSLRPELWTDFPLALPTGFDMSDIQREHAAAIEELVPSLLTLRQTCSDMSDGQFWIIYFIVLLPRLSEIDLELLSTSQIVEAREALLEKLQNKRDAHVESSGISETGNASTANEEIIAAPGNGSLSQSTEVHKNASSAGDRDVETEKLEGPLKHEDAGEDKSSSSLKSTEDVDDVSFSDLEDDDNDLSDRASGFRPSQSGRASSASESNEWVRLNENSGAHGNQSKSGIPTRRGKDSEGEESSDWLTVDDSDTDTLAGAF